MIGPHHFCRKTARLAAAVALLVVGTSSVGAQAPYSWPHTATETIQSRFPPPPGYHRVPAPAGSFAEWLRNLPLKPGAPPVHLFDGRLKANQQAHLAVVDIDVGDRNLQQCADAVIRLRAEYLYGTGRPERVCFHFTSGDLACFSRWAAGERPKVTGNRVTWVGGAPRDDSYSSFRRYLDTVFTYAGTYSLRKETAPVRRIEEAAIGDVFVQGGFPGHAVLIADMAVHEQTGSRVFLLLQSFMPAQEIHVLRAPRGSGTGAWYRLDFGKKLITPEWTFGPNDLRRFREQD